MTAKQERDRVLAMLEQKRKRWINEARAVAKKIGKANGEVTINDLRKVVSLPAGYHVSTWGAVLRGKQFKPIGYTNATHLASHARTVRVYKIIDIKE